MLKRAATILGLIMWAAAAAWCAAPPSDIPLELPGPESTPMPPLPVARSLGTPDADLDRVLDELDRAFVGDDLVLKGLPGPEKAFRSAAEWRRLADAAAARGAYAQAAEAYRREAEAYRRTGDPQAAQIEEARAQRYATDLCLYLSRPATEEDARRLDTPPATRGGIVSRCTT